MVDSILLPNFALGIPRKMNNEPIKKLKMKKKTISIIVILLFAGVANATSISFDEEEYEKQSKPDKTGNQEEPCYDISSTYFGATGQLAIRFATSIAHVNIEICSGDETIMSLSDLNKAKGSYEWINLSCFGCGDYDIFVTVDDCIIHYVSITI